MRQFVWYIPEIDVLTIQHIMDDCDCAFEFGNEDRYVIYVMETNVIGLPMIYLGEL